jgi:hypothetical protein
MELLSYTGAFVCAAGLTVVVEKSKFLGLFPDQIIV